MRYECTLHSDHTWIWWYVGLSVFVCVCMYVCVLSVLNVCVVISQHVRIIRVLLLTRSLYIPDDTGDACTRVAHQSTRKLWLQMQSNQIIPRGGSIANRILCDGTCVHASLMCDVRVSMWVKINLCPQHISYHHTRLCICGVKHNRCGTFHRGLSFLVERSESNEFLN